MIKFLDLHRQYLSIRGEIDTAIANVIRDSAFIGGPAVRAFEEAFATYQAAKHCVGVANGTDAIEIALEALQLPPASEVIVPANTFIASSEAVSRAGHRVVFADVNPETYTVDLSDLVKRLTPRTRAILAVHLYGHPCDMDELVALARQHNLRLIEDCAQAHGAEYKGRRVGALGDVGTFSFYPGKNLGAYGDAGAIVTDDENIAKRCRMIANHGRIDKYNHLFEGRNSRLDGLQAAILSVKLNHLDGWIRHRGEIASLYIKHLSESSGIRVPLMRPYVRHAYHLFVVRSNQRDLLAHYLSDSGIQTGIHYPIALPKLSAYAHHDQSAANMLACTQDGELLSLPMGEHLSAEDVSSVVGAIRTFLSKSNGADSEPIVASRT